MEGVPVVGEMVDDIRGFLRDASHFQKARAHGYLRECPHVSVNPVSVDGVDASRAVCNDGIEFFAGQEFPGVLWQVACVVGNEERLSVAGEDVIQGLFTR